MEIICFVACFIFSASSSGWISKKESDFTIYYRNADKSNIRDYNSLIKKGLKYVKVFFRENDYKKQFDVYVHPNRNSLDSTWKHDWKMPEFKSECWMVASGIADRLDMISPAQWTTQSCEHDYSDKKETQSLITHELVHVYHAQLNKSKEFETENLDWFVEGLATYASGQLTKEKISQIIQALKENKIPSSLDDFWKGNMRYQLSGSVVMFIDRNYGRKKLISLLPLTKKSEVLTTLNTTEEKLLSDWRNFLRK